MRDTRDEFVLPTRLAFRDWGSVRLEYGDVLVFTNFRMDPARPVTRPFLEHTAHTPIRS